MAYQVPTYAVPALYSDEAKNLYSYLRDNVQTTIKGTRHVTVVKDSRGQASGSSLGWLSALFSPGIHIDASTRNIGIFNNSNNHSVTQISSTSSATATEKKAKKDENNKTAFIIAALAFTALGGLYSYFLGKSIAQKGDAETDLMQVQRLKEIAEESQRSAAYLVPSDKFSFDTQMHQVNAIVDASKDVFVFKRSEAMTDIVLNTSLIGAAIIGAVGSVLASSVVIGVGVTAGLSVAVVKLVKLGINATNSKRMQLSAEIVEKNTKALLGVSGHVHNPEGASPVVMELPYRAPTASAPGIFE